MNAAVDEVLLPWCGTTNTVLRNEASPPDNICASCAASISPVSSRLRPWASATRKTQLIALGLSAGRS